MKNILVSYTTEDVEGDHISIYFQKYEGKKTVVIQANQQDALSVFIYSAIFGANLHVSNDHSFHHQEFMILQLCTVNQELLTMNEMVVRNM